MRIGYLAHNLMHYSDQKFLLVFHSHLMED